MNIPRIGEILVSRGVLTPDQVDQVLTMQRRRREPFGLLAEEMFAISTKVLEEAWAEQYSYITATIDPGAEGVDKAVIGTLSRRQAWQFKILPVRYDGAEVMVCTAKPFLAKALRFAYQHFGPSCYMVLTDEAKLAAALGEHYPMPGVEHVAGLSAYGLAA